MYKKTNEATKKIFDIKDIDFFLIRKEALSKDLIKTLKVKEALARGDALTIVDAIEEFDLTKDRFQKYRNSIFPFYEASDDKILTLLLTLEHQPGILAKVLRTIASHLASVVVINQSFPVNDIANVYISIDISQLNVDVSKFKKAIEVNRGVRKVEILGWVKK